MVLEISSGMEGDLYLSANSKGQNTTQATTDVFDNPSPPVERFFGCSSHPTPVLVF